MVATIKIIFLLSFLIIIHELGHYIVAKICKIKVNQFSVGFGPVLWSKKGKETEYELRLIPLGGFVSLEGEEGHSEEESSFNKASIPKRIAVIIAGALVNIAFGIIAYFILISIKYKIVIGGTFLSTIQYGLSSTGELIQTMFSGIADLCMGKLNLNDMTGPVGISAMVSKTNGITEFIYLLSIISISLGITNLLPVIPLDGGKVVLLLIEAIRKKPLKQEIEAKIQSFGFIILIIFSIIVTCNDIVKII